MNNLFLFKAHNFSNRITEVTNTDSMSDVLPGAYYTEGQSVNESKAVKSAWNAEFFSIW